MTQPLRRLRIDNLSLDLAAEADDPDALSRAVAQHLHLPPDALADLQPLKRSIDTRRTPRVIYSLHVDVPRAGRFDGDDLPPGVIDAPPLDLLPHRDVPPHQRGARVVVVGAGPAGLFAAIALARAGLRPILLDRGKPVESRARDVSRLMHWGELQHESNLCFGEGGAGTWSDGKLTTRVNAPQVRHILETLVEMGAPERILLDGKPHLGTDRLITILKAFRAALIASGAEVRFSARVDRLDLDHRGQVTGVTLADGERIDASRVVLAVGHSSHDLYHHLLGLGVTLVPKPFAVGFRIEHPQATINALQYGPHRDNPLLPAADYRLTANVGPHKERGVYSFCMCPGGQVVPTPTEHDGVVVNGMSHAARSGAFANSALVVTVDPKDFGPGTLAGLHFQRRAERTAGALGGGLFRAPAQRLTDYLHNRPPRDLPKTSYTPGTTPADLTRCYPDFVHTALAQALKTWARRMPAFVSDEAVLLGVETRTSAPVQITRDPASLQAVANPGLYPCGEGAGYGGGIVSAAVDGLRIAHRILDELGAASRAA